jgi:transcriptional regulator with XRE-family HTH domain
VVNTNELLRRRASRLVALGVSQKVLAAKMGMQPATLSRWLNQKDGIGPVDVSALDGFNAYVLELSDALSERGTEQAAARSVFHGREKRSGKDRRHAVAKFKGKDRRSGKDRRHEA